MEKIFVVLLGTCVALTQMLPDEPSDPLKGLSVQLRDLIADSGGISVSEVKTLVVESKLKLSGIGYSSHWGQDALGSISHVDRIDRHIAFCFTVGGKDRYLLFCVDVTQKDKHIPALDAKNSEEIARNLLEAWKDSRSDNFLFSGASFPQDSVHRFQSLESAVPPSLEDRGKQKEEKRDETETGPVSSSGKVKSEK